MRFIALNVPASRRTGTDVRRLLTWDLRERIYFTRRKDSEVEGNEFYAGWGFFFYFFKKKGQRA
jgi:hypothetical protein